MGRHKKEVFKKVEPKKAEVKKEVNIPKPLPQKEIDESNFIITKDLDKFSRLQARGYKFKEARVDAIGVKTFVFYKN